jgi:hypothetical protein
MIARLLQHYPWLVYIAAAIVYTTLEFAILSTQLNLPIFSGRNAKSPQAVIAAHLVFLTILMGYVWLAVYIWNFRYNDLPDWLTSGLGGPNHGSLFDVALVGVPLALGALERRWIFEESDAGIAKSERTLE